MKFTKGRFAVVKLKDGYAVKKEKFLGHAISDRIAELHKYESDMEGNANLICEAFNVATETGKTPQRLADENKELLVALKDITRHYRLYLNNTNEAVIQNAINAINNATK